MNIQDTSKDNSFRKLDLQLNEILENSFDIVFLLKYPELKPIYFNNEPAKNLLGYSVEFLFQMDIKSILPTEDASLYDSLINDCLFKGSAEGELKIKRIDGNLLWIMLKLRTLKNSEGRPTAIIGNCNDITKLKQMEQKLISNARYISLGEMANGMAHEINNPLMIISGGMKHLRRLFNISDNKTEFETLAFKIENAVKRIVEIIEGLKSFSKVPSKEEKEQCTINDILQDALKFCFARYKEASIDFKIKEHANLNSYVFARRYQISYALLQLLNNSFDAVEKLSLKWIELEIHISHGNIVFSVTDSGPAISNIILSKIMEPFFTTKEVGKGKGLGLSIAKGIAEEHHGNLYHDYYSGHTRFNMELPLSH